MLSLFYLNVLWAVLIFCCLREKIAFIVSQGKGIPDEDAPHVLAETKYWCTVQKKQEDLDTQEIGANITGNAKVDKHLLGFTSAPLMGVEVYTGATSAAILNASSASGACVGTAAAKAPAKGLFFFSMLYVFFCFHILAAFSFVCDLSIMCQTYGLQSLVDSNVFGQKCL